MSWGLQWLSLLWFSDVYSKFGLCFLEISDRKRGDGALQWTMLSLRVVELFRFTNKSQTSVAKASEQHLPEKNLGKHRSQKASQRPTFEIHQIDRTPSRRAQNKENKKKLISSRMKGSLKSSDHPGHPEGWDSLEQPASKPGAERREQGVTKAKTRLGKLLGWVNCNEFIGMVGCSSCSR